MGSEHTPARTLPHVQVIIRYFAAAREAAGTDSETVTADDGATVEALFAELVTSHPDLAGATSGLRFAVGDAFVPSTTPLHDGATLALIPPVGGG